MRATLLLLALLLLGLLLLGLLLAIPMFLILLDPMMGGQWGEPIHSHSLLTSVRSAETVPEVVNEISANQTKHIKQPLLK